jgi:hypothetical protein
MMFLPRRSIFVFFLHPLKIKILMVLLLLLLQLADILLLSESPGGFCNLNREENTPP